MPGATDVGRFTTKVMATELPPGMVNVPHTGEVAPAVGLLTAGRDAVPPSVIALVLASVNALVGASGSLIETLDAVPAPFWLVIVMV